ncbi:hypothetical protein WUBG_17044 [Wuchereria bancrofti]|uniref:Uncharacterized protein n=1 Tax=Wuchereria bancrofti TaxID=6293 RepID=J9ADJ5_WUCBA|nr:hypothetical protein WUBG_17044 [Wuchereria bancrofti]
MIIITTTTITITTTTVIITIIIQLLSIIIRFNRPLSMMRNKPELSFLEFINSLL